MLPTKFRKVLIHNVRVRSHIHVFYAIFYILVMIDFGDLLGIRNAADAEP